MSLLLEDVDDLRFCDLYETRCFFYKALANATHKSSFCRCWPSCDSIKIEYQEKLEPIDNLIYEWYLLVFSTHRKYPYSISIGVKMQASMPMLTLWIKQKGLTIRR